MIKKRISISGSLQWQLVLAVGLCLVLVAGLTIGYAAWTSYNGAVDSAKQTAVGMAEVEADRIQSQIETALYSARITGYQLTAIKVKDQPISLSREQVSAMLLSVLQRTPELFATYTLWEPDAFDGQDSTNVNKPGHDASGRFIPYWYRGGSNGSIDLAPLTDYETTGVGDYYLLPKQTQKESIIEPYSYAVGGKDVLMTSLIEPIVVDGQFYGISGVDLTLDYLQGQADQVDLYDKTGKIELISHTGIIAASTGRPELVNHPLSDEMDDSQDFMPYVEGGKQYVDVHDNYLTVYTPIVFGNTDTPWSLRVQVPFEVIVAGAKQQTLYMIVLAAVLILLGQLGIWYLVGRIAVKPLKIMSGALNNLRMGNLNRDIPQSVKDAIVQRSDEIGVAGKGLADTEIYLIGMAETARQIAAGDLTVTVTPRCAEDELGSAFSQMVTGLRQSMGQVAENANMLGAASEQLAAVAGQTADATSQIAATIQQIAKGTGQQTAAITLTSQSVDQVGRAVNGVAKGAEEQSVYIERASVITGQIGAAVNQVYGNAQAVTRDSAETARVAKAGVQTMRETIQGMETIKVKVSVSAEKVKEMGLRSDKIGTILETIGDIASQTNLLALNAAIEAARAGEQGKGFAVVADEVRKLAERAASSTKEIDALVRDIQSSIREAVTAMGESAGEVENGVVKANQAGDSLEEILKAAEGVFQQASQATQATEQMKSAAGELVSAMDSVSAVVEQNKAATVEMSAGSNEVTQAIENIASVSEENSAAVEEVSASAEEMSAQVEEVTGSAQSLAEMAEALKQVVSQFRLTVEEQEHQGKPQAAHSGSTFAAPHNGNGKNGRHLEQVKVLNR